MRHAAASGAGRAFHYVVVYDVANDRQRDRVATALLDVGTRVGLSVFAARLTSAEAGATLERLAGLIDPATDRVHLHRFCAVCDTASVRVGVPWRQPDTAAVAVL